VLIEMSNSLAGLRSAVAGPFPLRARDPVGAAPHRAGPGLGLGHTNSPHREDGASPAPRQPVHGPAALEEARGMREAKRERINFGLVD
jgi:hypothetical protein